MSQALFLEFNKYFAWFSDYIKSLITGNDIHSKNGEGLDQLKKNIQKVLNYQEQRRLDEKENSLTFYNLSFFIHNFLEIEKDLPPVFWPVMILYTNTAMPVETFVKHRLGYDYPTDIAQFDITLMPRTKPTKKDPHFSFFMTTYEMLDHDAFHIGRSLADFLRVPLFETNDAFLKKIYHLSKEMGPNERKIVISALFLITHEMVSILMQDDPNLNETRDWHIIIDILKRDFKDGALRYPQRDISYKSDLRDLEFALKGVTDLNNEPFLPPNFTGELRPPQDIRQQAVSDGFERFWETFRSLLVQHNLLEPRSSDTPFENNTLILDESISGSHEPSQIENNGIIPEMVKSSDS